MAPKWPFLLMYGSHDMRHIGFRGLTSCQRDPRDSGHQRSHRIEPQTPSPLVHTMCMSFSVSEFLVTLLGKSVEGNHNRC